MDMGAPEDALRSRRCRLNLQGTFRSGGHLRLALMKQTRTAMDNDEIELRCISGSPVRDEADRRRRMELWKRIDARAREQAAGASNVDATNVVFLSRFPTKEPVCIICCRAASFAENFFLSQGR